jgi:hypothetical protein
MGSGLPSMAASPMGQPQGEMGCLTGKLGGCRSGCMWVASGASPSDPARASGPWGKPSSTRPRFWKLPQVRASQQLSESATLMKASVGHVHCWGLSVFPQALSPGLVHHIHLLTSCQNNFATCRREGHAPHFYKSERGGVDSISLVWGLGVSGEGGAEGGGFARGTGQYNEEVWKALDWVLDEAGKRDVRLIIPVEVCPLFLTLFSPCLEVTWPATQ